MRPDPVERRRGGPKAPPGPDGPHYRAQDPTLRRHGRHPRGRPPPLHNPLRALRRRRLRRAQGAVKLYTADEMSRADGGAQDLGIPGGVLMERAGVAMAEEILKRYPNRRALVVCGGGNNGGDGFVIARELHRAGAEAAVVATTDELSGDPATNREVLGNLGVDVHGPEMLDALLPGTSLVVDALLGTGFSGEVRERGAALIRHLNDAGVTTVAVDVPSGVDGSTGEVAGEAVRADLTVCAHAAKVGCVISPGREHAGETVVVEIGIPPEADVEPSLSWTDRDALSGLVPRTKEPAHKYSAGAVMVVAGSRAMTGAAGMSVRGAERAGCGITLVARSAGAAPAVDVALTETIVYGVREGESGGMGAGAEEEILDRSERATALVVGPGIGTGEEGRALVEALLSRTDLPVLLDADAVTVLAGADALARRDAP